MITLHLDRLDNLDDILKPYDTELPIKIYLAKGTYELKLRISRNNLHFIGYSNETVIKNSDYAFKMHQGGLLYNTFRSQTVLITSSNITFENIIIINNAGRGDLIGQSIALSVYGTHNRFKNCQFISHQDTLFIGPLPIELTTRYDHILSIEEQTQQVGTHVFENCVIKGDVDYVFGSGTAIFKHCRFVSTNDGFVFAPSTYESTKYGFIVYQSVFYSTSNQYKVIIARPWRDHGKVYLIDNQFISPIATSRFDDWSKDIYHFIESPYVYSPYSTPMNDSLKSEITKFIEAFR